MLALKDWTEPAEQVMATAAAVLINRGREPIQTENHSEY